MFELRNARQMLDQAEHAARAGDFVSADQLLRDIARIQEAELGPGHPELANTLNNLAIVAERRGRPHEAETFYRRSAAIASATLPPDHPMVVTSRQNLEAFRLARQSLTDTPSMNVSAKDAALGLDVFAREDAARAKKTTPAEKPAAPAAPELAAPAVKAPEATAPLAKAPEATAPAAEAPEAKAAAATASAAHARAAKAPEAKRAAAAKPSAEKPPAQDRRREAGVAGAAQASSAGAQVPFDIPLADPRLGATPPQPLGPSRASRSRGWVVMAVVVGVTVGVLASRGWSLRDAAALLEISAALLETPPAPQEAEPAPEPPAAAAKAPAKNAPRPPRPAPPADERGAVADVSSASSAASGAISLADADVCRTFSTGSFRCEPVGDSVNRGRVVLYTRVRSARGGTVVHDWYHGGTLRQSVPLTVRPNASEGFRTYSRQTVNEPGEWRVEVKSQDGNLLHEQRFTVR